MSSIVSFVGQKGGSSKSILAQAYAVHMAMLGCSVVMADMDHKKPDSHRWGNRRSDNNFDPAIRVHASGAKGGISKARVFELADTHDVLVLDCGGDTDAQTTDIANRSDLLVVPTKTSVDELDPAIILLHDLRRVGVPDRKVVVPLTRVSTPSQEKFARTYLQEAGYAAMPISLQYRPIWADIKNDGRTLVETGRPNIDDEARLFLKGITDAVEASQAHNSNASPKPARKPRKLSEVRQ